MSETTDLAGELDALAGVVPDRYPARDASHFRRIVAAHREVAGAEAELVRAVADARAAGESWTVVGAALGISRQAAQQRFGHRV